MFPAALIFIASAAKKKLQAFLEVQKGLQAAIEDHQDQMNYCIQEIQREKNCGLLQKLLQPVRLLKLHEHFPWMLHMQMQQQLYLQQVDRLLRCTLLPLHFPRCIEFH